MVTIDNSPRILHFKQRAGTTIILPINFFTKNIGVQTALDISSLSFKVIGRLKGSSSILLNSVFDASVVASATALRQGVFLSTDATNRIILYYDFVADTDNLQTAPEGIFEFTIWMTDAAGTDVCVVSAEYDCLATYGIEITEADVVNGDINVICQTNLVTVNCNVRILQLPNVI